MTHETPEDLLSLSAHTLTLDFGNVGWRNDEHPFAVLLDVAPLTRLVADASNAYRVYELMLIDRPGDIWEYVQVTSRSLPPRVAEGLLRLQGKRTPHPPPGTSPSGTSTPLCDFDTLFRWAWDDTDPEDEAWLTRRTGPQMRQFASEALTMLQAFLPQLGIRSPLIAHEMASIAAGTHPFAYLPREEAIQRGREHEPNAPIHPESYYQFLRELLSRPDVKSVAYRGGNDYVTYRVLCEEQRARANSAHCAPEQAFEIHALAQRHANNEPWQAHIRYYEEGLGDATLLIDEANMGGGSAKDLVETHYRLQSARYILARQDEGDIQGFLKTSGNGWYLYTRPT